MFGILEVIPFNFQAYELSTLTGTQVMLLVASETGHVYTFATRKLQPMITSDSGKALIQTCLNSPDPPPGSTGPMSIEQRMNPTGFEETELSYAVSEEENVKVKIILQDIFTVDFPTCEFHINIVFFLYKRRPTAKIILTDTLFRSDFLPPCSSKIVKKKCSKILYIL